MFVWWYLMPLSTISQLYRGSCNIWDDHQSLIYVSVTVSTVSIFRCTIVYLTFLCKSMRLSAYTPQNYFQSPDWSTNQKLGNIAMVYRDTVTLFKEQPNFLFSLQEWKGMASRLTKLIVMQTYTFIRKKSWTVYSIQ